MLVVLGVDGGERCLRVTAVNAVRFELPGDAPWSAVLHQNRVTRVGRGGAAIIECALVTEAREGMLDGLGGEGLPLQSVAELRRAQLAARQQRQADRIRIWGHVRRRPGSYWALAVDAVGAGAVAASACTKVSHPWVSGVRPAMTSKNRC